MINYSVLQFSHLEIDEMVSLGIQKGLYSPYNVKAVDNNGFIVGCIIVTETQLCTKNFNCVSKQIRDKIDVINQNRWFNLRSLKMNKEYQFTGNVEHMFDYLVYKTLPNDCYLWSNSYWDRKTRFLDELGFYKFPKQLKLNPNIKIFSVYHARNE